MKLERHSKIVELIGKKEIETQEELVEELRLAGFRVTQATVSRDIREMRLTKVATDNGKQRYTVMQNEDPKIEKYVRILRDSYVGMDSENGLRYGHGGCGFARCHASPRGGGLCRGR